TTVSVATEIRDASNNAVTSVPLGTTVHDRAFVSGGSETPPGTVDFTCYTRADCTTGASDAGTVALDANGVADPSRSRRRLAAGAYAVRGHYGGDASCVAADRPCEPPTVTQATPSAATEIRDAGNNVVTTVPLGTTVHDRAVVAGAAGFTPTG